MQPLENQKHLDTLDRLNQVQKTFKTIVNAMLWAIVLSIAIAIVRYLVVNIGNVLWVITTPIVKLLGGS